MTWQWQPIATAPIDGTRLLLWDPKADVCIGFSYETLMPNHHRMKREPYRRWIAECMVPVPFAPTHWQRIPKPPEQPA